MPTAIPPFRALIVDRNKKLTHIIALVLHTRGYEVRVTDRFDCAALIGREFNPQVLITEVLDPESEGMTLAQSFSDRYPNCHIVMLYQGSLERNTFSKMVEARRDPAFLKKPFLPSELLRTLNELRGE